MTRRPEPDLAVVPRGDYDAEHPKHAFTDVEIAVDEVLPAATNG